MGLYLHVEVESSLSPSEFQTSVIVPLQAALQQAGVGSLIIEESEDEQTPSGVYELFLDVTDQHKAHEIVEQIIKDSDLLS